MRRHQAHLTIKVCGITNATDALAAIEAGANALGLIFVPESQRSLTLAAARDVVAAVRKEEAVSGAHSARLAGVFRNESPRAMVEVIQALGLGCAQLHGEESPEICQSMPVPVIKALTVWPNMTPEALIATLERYTPSEESNIEVLLLDTPKTLETTTHAWARVAHLLADTAVQERLQRMPHWLAGGLTADTVADVVGRFRPDGVDVASGVEQSPGRKDHERLRAFCAAVRRAERRLSSNEVGAGPARNEPVQKIEAPHQTKNNLETGV